MVSTRASVLFGLVLGLILASLLQWVLDKNARHWASPRPRPRHGRGHRRRDHQGRRKHLQEFLVEELALQPPPPPPSPAKLMSSWVPHACPLNCSGRGVCNEDTGMCLCPMGRDGPGCEQLDPFPCNLPHGEQLVARCSGVCNLESSKCSCGGGKYPERSMHKCVFQGIAPYMRWDGPGWDYETVAKEPSAFWSRAADAPEYLRKHPSLQAAGSGLTLPSRTVPWCDAEPALVDRGVQRPAVQCRCEEGTSGRLCEARTLHACLNQCNGRGTCQYGYCLCDPSWYGVDCSLHRGRIVVAQPLARTAEAAAEEAKYQLDDTLSPPIPSATTTALHDGAALGLPPGTLPSGCAR